MNKTAKRWLYLPVEIRVREFDARLLLACCAVERGYNVVIGMKNGITQHYPVLPRGIIFDRSLSTFREGEFQRMVDWGYHLCSNDEETFAFYITPESVLRQRVSHKSLELTDWYFAWGQKQADMINETYPGHADKIKVLGTYRGDLNLPEFQRSMWGEEVKKLQERFGHFILLPTNFSEVENNIGGRKFTIDQMFEQGAIYTQDEATFFEDFLDHKERNLTAYKDVIPKIQKAFPDHKIVIRPHPGEAHEHWEAFAQKHPGLVVLHEGPVTPWLIAADVVFHHGCSTGLETFLLGKPSIPYHPHLNLVHDVHLSTKIGPIVETEEDFLELMKIAIEGGELPRDDISWLNDYIVLPDGERLISDHIVDAFDELDVAPERMSAFSYLPARLKIYARRQLNTFKRRVKRMLGGKIEPSRHTKRWGYMTPEDVLGFISIFQDVTGRFDGVKVEKLPYGQVFCLYKGD